MSKLVNKLRVKLKNCQSLACQTVKKIWLPSAVRMILALSHQQVCLHPCTFIVNNYFVRVLCLRNHPSHMIPILATTKKYYLSTIHWIHAFRKDWMIEELRNTLSTNIASRNYTLLWSTYNHCYYLCTTQVLRGTFWERWRIQIQIYTSTSIEPKYGAF